MKGIVTTVAAASAIAWSAAWAGPAIEVDIVVNGGPPAEYKTFVQDLTEKPGPPPAMPSNGYGWRLGKEENSGKEVHPR